MGDHTTAKNIVQTVARAYYPFVILIPQSREKDL